MKTKSKVAKDLKSRILEQSRHYTRTSEHNAVEDDYEDEAETNKTSAAEKQKKREKMRLKRELKRKAKEENPKKDEVEAKEEGLKYLHLFNTDKDSWSFRKKQQVWLLKNVFNDDNISEEDFQILLEYLVDLKGAAKTRLMEECEETTKKEEDGDSSITSVMFERARRILQILV